MTKIKIAGISLIAVAAIVIPLAFSQTQTSVTTAKKTKKKVTKKGPAFEQKMKGWKVTADDHAGATKMAVRSLKSGRVVLNYTPKDKTSRIFDANEVRLEKYPNPILVTRWKKGPHDHVIRIFDPKKKEPLLIEHQSDWRIEYEVIKESVLIRYYFRKLEMSKKWTPESQ